MLGIIFLAIIQGIAEFLPISSSAHLIIFRSLFKIGVIPSNMDLIFDISLHIGTLLAVLIYFYNDIFNILKKLKANKKLIINIILSTIPAGIIGFLFEDIIDNIIRNNLYVISLALIIMGIIIYKIDKNCKEIKGIDDITMKDSLLIGISQIFALIPGFSRSGVTIAQERLLGLDRTCSSKYSFFLSIPVILGAAIISLTKDNSIYLIQNNFPFFIIGILVSFISGMLCINYFLKYIKKHDFKIFMWYRLILGIVVLLILFIK